MSDEYTVKLFTEQKAKAQKRTLDWLHWIDMYGHDVSMFEYGNMPKTLSGEWLEKYLCGTGASVVAKVDGDLIAMTGSRGEDLDVYGLGTIAVAHTCNGKSFTGRIGEDCAYIYNNITHTPDIDLCVYSAYLAEVEQSLNLSILMSRDFKLPVATNNNEIQQIKSAVSAMREGKPVEIISASVQSLLKDTNGKAFDTLEISDPAHVQHIQYLLKAREDIGRWFWLKYGHNISSGGTIKMAQTNSNEINQDDSVSQVYPFEKLKQRQIGIDAVNKIFGTDITVDFSEIWKHENEKYLADMPEKTDESEGDDDGNTDENTTD